MDFLQPFLGETLSIGSALAWSAGVVIYKYLGATVPPIHLNLLKNLIVLAFILPTWVVIEGWNWPTISSREVTLSVLSGVLGIAIADTLYFYALNILGAARLGIIGNFYSPFVLGLAFLFLSERLTGLQWVGFGLVTTGVLLVSQQQLDSVLTSTTFKRGLLYGVGSVFLMAMAIVMVKRTLTDQALLWIVTLRMLGGVAGLGVIFFWRGESFLQRALQLNSRQWVTLIFAAFVGQYISMVLWLGGYKYTSASVAAILNETASIFILLMAWLFLREKLTLRKLIGATLSLGGVIFMLVK